MCLLLGGVAAGCTVVVAADPAALQGCPVAFAAADQAAAALAAGVEEVLACSLTPLGTRLAALPAMVLDAAVELPGHGDHFSGRPGTARIQLGAVPFTAPPLALGPDDRVLTALSPATAEGLGALLGVLATGAALILLASGDRAHALREESATAWIDESGVHRCGG